MEVLCEKKMSVSVQKQADNPDFWRQSAMPASLLCESFYKLVLLRIKAATENVLKEA